MGNELLSEDEVKAKLGIESFRNLKKGQLIEFVSMIPNMDKEVAKACVTQFPNFKEYATTVVSHYDSLCKLAIENDSSGSIRAYQSIINNMSSILEKSEISSEERQYLIDKMIEVAKYIENVEDKKRVFKKHVLQIGGAVAVFVSAATAAILGVKINKKR